MSMICSRIPENAERAASSPRLTNAATISNARLEKMQRIEKNLDRHWG